MNRREEHLRRAGGTQAIVHLRRLDHSRHRHRRRRVVGGWRLAFGVILLAGCDDGRPTRIQVAGQITFAGGACPADGRLIFAATKAAPGFPMRPGYATFETDGKYRATTWTEGDGLMPGKYLVGVECWKVKPAFEVAGISYVAGQYMHPRTSGIELEVAANSDYIEKDFDFPRLPQLSHSTR